jgi:AcrR family transcriptional regulator
MRRAGGGVAAARPPQQDRSRATRQRLLTAAVACLAELGWSGATVQVVAARAGVSRGAAQHHFPTREALVDGAIGQMRQLRAAEMARATAALPAGRRRTDAVLHILFDLYSGPVFRAALQLWVAAAADAALRAQIAPLEAELGRQAHRMALELLRVDERQPGVRETVQATLDLVRGLGLADLLTDDRHRRAGLLRQAARTLDTVLPEAGREPPAGG